MIDAHHHFWRYRPADYGWIDDDMAVLKRDFLPADLETVAAEKGITGVVSVQACESIGDNAFLLEQARTSALVKGVVGWIPLASPDAESQLEAFEGDPLFKGVREVMQGRKDEDFLENDAFNRGVRLLTARNLPYDVLIFEQQLESTIRFIDRHPAQRFILDHIAKPVIREAAFSETWAKGIRELATRENIICKFSGVVTEVRDPEWNVDRFRPYFETVLDAFGVKRLMFGSDWPVCLLRAGYGEWVDAVKALASDLGRDEQQQFFEGTATAAYGL